MITYALSIVLALSAAFLGWLYLATRARGQHHGEYQYGKVRPLLPVMIPGAGDTRRELPIVPVQIHGTPGLSGTFGYQLTIPAEMSTLKPMIHTSEWLDAQLVAFDDAMWKLRLALWEI